MDHRTHIKQSKGMNEKSWRFFRSLSLSLLLECCCYLLVPLSSWWFSCVRFSSLKWTSNVAYKQNMFHHRTESIILTRIERITRLWVIFVRIKLVRSEQFLSHPNHVHVHGTQPNKKVLYHHIKTFMLGIHTVCVCFRFRNGIKASMRSLSNRLYFKRIEMAFDSHRLNNPGDGIFMLISQMFVLSFSIATNC